MDFCCEDCVCMAELDIIETEKMLNYFNDLIKFPVAVDIAPNCMASASSPEVVPATKTEETTPIASKEFVDKHVRKTLPLSSPEALKEVAKNSCLSSVRRANVRESKRNGLESTALSSHNHCNLNDAERKKAIHIYFPEVVPTTKTEEITPIASKELVDKHVCKTSPPSAETLKEAAKNSRLTSVRRANVRESKRNELESTALSSHNQFNLNYAESKKAIHREAERNRRNFLKYVLQDLRRLIPSTEHNSRSSQVSILIEAIKYIHVLKTLLAKMNALQA